MQSYELCCDMIDVVIDLSSIYGYVSNKKPYSTYECSLRFRRPFQCNPFRWNWIRSISLFERKFGISRNSSPPIIPCLFSVLNYTKSLEFHQHSQFDCKILEKSIVQIVWCRKTSARLTTQMSHWNWNLKWTSAALRKRRKRTNQPTNKDISFIHV